MRRKEVGTIRRYDQIPTRRYVSREEYAESNKRIEAEHKRLNKRMAIVEDMQKQFNAMAISFKEMNANLTNLLKIQERHERQIEDHDGRLDTMEQKGSKKLDSIIDHSWKIVASGIIAYVLAKIGL